MIRHYLKSAFRNLLKNKLYSILNIAGLSIGIAVTIMIFSYIWFEHSFDRFHTNASQIYRVVQHYQIIDNERRVGGTSYELASILKESFPEIEHITRINYFQTNQEVEININGNKFIESQKGDNLVRADNAIFKIFDLVLAQGDTETALEDPYSIIITEEEADKFFGNKNPMGEVIYIRRVLDDKGQNYKITGIAKKMPDNSHFQFKYLIPQEEDPWYWFKYANSFTHTYFTLSENYPAKHLEDKLPDLVKKYFVSDIEDWSSLSFEDWQKSGGYWKLGLQQLKDIHLDNQHYDSHLIKKGSIGQIKTYMAIALLIIFLACINFITLSTAQARTRAMEIGVRKVNGASQKQLVRQFLVESISLSLITLLMALVLVKLFSSYFENLLEIQNSFDYAGLLFILISLLIVTLIVGVISGSYPAFFLSSFKPVNVLNRRFSEKIKGITIRNSLVVFQFIISIILIISSVSIFKQFLFMQNKEMGFDKENIVILEDMYSRLWMQFNKEWTPEEMTVQLTRFKQELLKNPNIIDASYARSIQGSSRVGYDAYHVRTEEDLPEKVSTINATFIDYNYLNVFGLEMIAGRNYRKTSTFPARVQGVILNEKAVKYLGLKNPVGKHIYIENWHESITNKEGELQWVKKEAKFPIIGVFKDFHTHNLYRPIAPTMYMPLYKGDHMSGRMAVKFFPGNTSENISFLKKIWNETSAIQPLKFSFFDQEFEAMYKKEKRLAQIFTFFSILAIFIACLGVFGLSVLTISNRTKEIGIRKVNGVTIGEIMVMLNKDFVKRFAVAFVIACPIAYYFIQRWLENFAYRTTLSWWVFALAGGFTLVITLFTVSWQSWKAAVRNPIEALRDE